MSNLTHKNNVLESLRRLTGNGIEYWRARDLQGQLGYGEWRNFKRAIKDAMHACDGNMQDSKNHFVESNKMVQVGSETSRQVEDYILSRYACYLIAMNGDPKKPEIAAAQSYFAVQTRRMELAESKSEEDMRLEARSRVKENMKSLNDAAQLSGVKNFGKFHNAGYKGLYGGLTKAEILAKKGLSAKDDLLDRAGRAELAANDFRLTQTELRLQSDGVTTESGAVETHHTVGKQVREAMERTGKTLPENLPAEASIKQIERARAKQLKASPSQ